MVSAPVSWDEVDDALARNDTSTLEHDAESVLERIDRLGDLFAANLTVEQELPQLDVEAGAED